MNYATFCSFNSCLWSRFVVQHRKKRAKSWILLKKLQIKVEENSSLDIVANDSEIILEKLDEQMTSAPYSECWAGSRSLDQDPAQHCILSPVLCAFGLDVLTVLLIHPSIIFLFTEVYFEKYWKSKIWRILNRIRNQ